MAASEKIMGQLHEQFAHYLMGLMNQKGKDDEGNEYVIPMTAAEAAVLRAFLKDNNIQADPDASTDIKALDAQLRKATGGAVTDAEMDLIMKEFADVTSADVTSLGGPH
jgi:hypothetical protein